MQHESLKLDILSGMGVKLDQERGSLLPVSSLFPACSRELTSHTLKDLGRQRLAVLFVLKPPFLPGTVSKKLVNKCFVRSFERFL